MGRWTAARRTQRRHRDMLTTSEAGRLMGVHPATVVRWIKRGKLRALTTPGGHRRIPQEEIESLWSGPGGGAPPAGEER